MSGTPLMLKPLPVSVTEITYSNIMQVLDLGTSSVNDRIEKLIKVSAEDLVAKTPWTTPLVPFLDGEVIPALTSFKSLAEDTKLLSSVAPGRQWCEDLMIGDCQHDVSVLLYV
jgi:hypothetical protein